MNKIKTRKADFIASLLLVAFGIFVISESLKMPLKASYGGVESHWYVSPALFPLFVGAMVVIMGGFLMGIAIKDGGMKALFFRNAGDTKIQIDEKTRRVLIVVLAIGSFVYVFVSRIDFFVGIATFLFYLTTVFYPENSLIRRRLTWIFSIESAVFALVALIGAWKPIYDAYVYTFDILAIFAFIAMVVTALTTARKEGVDKGKIRTTFWLSLIIPGLLCPVFRYPLRTPLPHEGLIIDYMNVVVFKARRAFEMRQGG
jgi:hypothetical protein